MTESHILQNFLSPPVLFFFLGLLATLLRSDLKIPQPLPMFLSLKRFGGVCLISDAQYVIH